MLGERKKKELIWKAAISKSERARLAMEMVGGTAPGEEWQCDFHGVFSVFGVRALLPLPEVARPKYFLMWVDYISNYKNSKLLTKCSGDGKDAGVDLYDTL